MGATPAATLAAVIDGYLAGEAGQVLAELDKDILVIGAKSHENFSSKAAVDPAIRLTIS